jgi:acetyl-CoA synthetase
VIAEEDGTGRPRTFAELVTRSDQVARWLAALGATRGTRVIVKLGNQIELGEAMLAVMELGAVILPTTQALPAADLAERMARTGAGCVIADLANTAPPRRPTPVTPRPGVRRR